MAVLALAACGGEPAPSAAPVSAPAVTLTVGVPGVGASHDGADYADWMTAMDNYDRALVDDNPLALNDGDQLCVDLRHDASGARAAKDAATLFHVDDARARKVVAITKDSLCSE